MEIRATDTERERVAERLRQAGQVGALEIEELEERLTAAYSARTRNQLEALVGDLPVLGSKPVITERSRWWLWAAFGLPVAAWLHALVITRVPRYGAYAIFYAIPVVLVAASDTTSEATEPAWLAPVFTAFWLVGAIHVAMSRDEVDLRRDRNDPD